MPESRSGRALTAQPAKAIEPTAGTRRQRLAQRLADMVPGAATIRVSQHGPRQTWPSPCSRAYDDHGQLITLNRAQGMTVARWIIRSHPDVSWDAAHDLDMATGILKPAARAYATVDGGR
ncbi:hypothetical protein T261_7025 [Streptomyces lydicus]|nr:hypothetical protein T261_7025 [Streptomyces lydicus]